MKAVAEKIVAGLEPEAKEMSKDEERQMIVEMKESAASSFIDAVKNGEATRVAHAFGELYDLCAELKEYDEEE